MFVISSILRYKEKPSSSGILSYRNQGVNFSNSMRGSYESTTNPFSSRTLQHKTNVGFIINYQNPFPHPIFSITSQLLQLAIFDIEQRNDKCAHLLLCCSI